MPHDLDAVKDFYAAINRNDTQSFARDFDPAIVRAEFEGTPAAGTFRGIDAVRQNVAAGRGTWAEGRCEPEKFLVEGEKVVVYVHARVRLHGATEWTGGRFADGFAFRDGKITEFHSFAERAQALAWAGIADADAG